MNLVNFGEGKDATLDPTVEACKIFQASEKETKMKRNRLFNVFVTVALVLMAVLTIRGSLETTKVASAASGPDQALAPHNTPFCDNPAVRRSSIQRIYVGQMDTWLMYTDGGPTGVDGGLIHILSNSRVCSK